MANQTGFSTTTKFSDEVRDGADLCDHVTAEDLSNAVGYFYERDSFGLVGAYICCQACTDAGKNAEAEELVCCDDCKLSFPRKQTIAWKWYDFYAAQGDEPTIVCDTCQDADKHKARVAQDQRNYNEEFGDNGVDDFFDLDDDSQDEEEEEIDDDQFVDEGEV